MTEREKALREAFEAIKDIPICGSSMDFCNGLDTAASAVSKLLTGPTDDGWIPWSGGECPVDPETEVMLRLGDGGPEYGPVHAGATVWKAYGCSGDIIAYKIISESEKPKDAQQVFGDHMLSRAAQDPLDRPVTVLTHLDEPITLRDFQEAARALPKHNEVAHKIREVANRIRKRKAKEADNGK